MRSSEPCPRRFEWEGSTANPIAVDPSGPVLYHVVRDEGAPPAERYKGLFGVANRQPAVSPNGLDWTVLDVSRRIIAGILVAFFQECQQSSCEQVPHIPSRDESQFSFDPYTQRWLACVKQPTEYGRSVFLATSPADDFGGSSRKLFLYRESYFLC